MISFAENMIKMNFQRIFETFLREQDLAINPIESYNAFIETDIKNILNDNIIRSEKDFDVRFSDPYIEAPDLDELNPSQCRKEKLSYEAQLFITVAKYVNNKVQKDDVYKIKLCNLPLMIGSNIDPLVSLSREERLDIGEAAEDPGGYFVMEGSEKILLMQERSRPRYPSLFRKSSSKSKAKVDGFVTESSPLNVFYTSGQSLTDIDSKVLKVFEKNNIIYCNTGFKEYSFNIFYMFHSLWYLLYYYDLSNKVEIEAQKARQANRAFNKNAIMTKNLMSLKVRNFKLITIIIK